MEVLVVTHVDSEGPGSLGEHLASSGVRVRTVRLHRGDALPRDFGALSAAICLGGPMNVYEEDRHPFLADETSFLRAAAARGLPVLGICLGAQLIARAAGAPVTKNPVAELCWDTVTLTDEGYRDRLFRELPPTLPVFQWHEDTFALPEGGKLLAVGKSCRNQALRFGSLYGLQFHLEVTRPMLGDWFAGREQLRGILRRYDELRPLISRCARNLCVNFLEIAARSGRAAPVTS